MDIFREHSQRGVISSAVLLDVDMRDLGGMQLAEISLASPGATQIIMMLRSPLDSERANECKRLGIITIFKPLRRLSLWQVLHSQTAIPAATPAIHALLESRIRLREPAHFASCLPRTRPAQML